MPNTIGLNCQIILDGQGYYLEPNSYHVARPRIRRADLTGIAASGAAGAGERYLDRGPGKRTWRFTVVGFQSMTNYDGSAVASTGQQYRDALVTSYQKVNTTLAFSDPASTAWTVRFDDLIEELADLRAQVDGLQYYLHCTLVEA